MLVARYASPTLGMAIRRRLVLTTLAFCGVAVFAVESLGRRERTTPPWTFEIEMRASGGTFAQLFWGADQDFVEGRSIRLSLQPGADLVQRLRFPIPSHGVLWLRFDPTDAPGEIVIGGVRLLDSSGRVLTSLDPKRFQPAHDIASVSEQNDGVH